MRQDRNDPTPSLEPPPDPSLDDLIAAITPNNRHRAIDTGPAIGQEVW